MITEESFIDFRCPYCQEPVSFPRETAGFVEMCPSCTESLIVPGDGSEEGLKIPLPRPTPRLVLRRLAPGDWRDLLELMADEEFFRYQDATPLDEDGVLRWLQSDGHVKLTTPDQPFIIGIQVQEGEKLIGYASLPRSASSAAAPAPASSRSRPISTATRLCRAPSRSRTLIWSSCSRKRASTPPRSGTPFSSTKARCSTSPA